MCRSSRGHSVIFRSRLETLVLKDGGFNIRMMDIKFDKEITDYLLACRYQRSRLCLNKASVGYNFRTFVGFYIVLFSIIIILSIIL